MTDSANEAAHSDGEPPIAPSVNLKDYLDSDLVVTDMDVTSKKRLFEKIAVLIAKNNHDHGDNGADDEGDDNDVNRLSSDLIFDTLYNRERLGCTALGKGIALPHGRIEGLCEPVISIARLKQPIDYDAPDRVPVWLSVCLLVPENANDMHLSLLAVLAGKFSDEQFVRDIKKPQPAETLYNIFTSV